MKFPNYNISRIYFGFLLALLGIFTSCENVVDIDLNGCSPVLVADGLMEYDSVATICLSYTRDYFSNDDPVYAQNLDVSIVDDEGNSETLEYQGEGLYKGKYMKGVLNLSYKLTFAESGTEYIAESTLKSPTTLEDISFEESTYNPIGLTPNKYFISLTFSDNSCSINYYLIRFWVNGKFHDGDNILIENTYLTENGIIEYSPTRIQFEKYDHVLVRVYSIDKSTYIYYHQINDLVGGWDPAASTPYNPQSNFGSEVMGYFAAWSSVSDSAVVE